MNLQQIRSAYLRRLSGAYPKNEINSIFSLACLHLLKYSQIDIHFRKNEKVQGEIKHKFSLILDRLLNYEPIQYIIGATEFYNLILKTDKRALIPRQETELMVDIIIKDISGKQGLKVIDLCTGSGCIAIALASNLRKSEVTATDISADVLDLAKENALQNQTNISFIKDSILNPEHNYGSYDLVVSNPPYVRELEKVLMSKNVIEYEPHAALFVSDSDPLIFYKAIAFFGTQHLAPGGTIWCEINEVLGKETAEVFRSTGLEVIIHKDLNNKERFIKAIRM